MWKVISVVLPAILKYFLILALCSTIAYGAVQTGYLNVSLSLNNKVSLSPKSYRAGYYITDMGDVINQFGSGSAEKWGYSAIPRVGLSNKNFSVYVNFSDSIGGGSFSGTGKGVDHVYVIVYYTLPSLNLSFVKWTPNNNSYIGSTIKVNVSSAVANLSSCILESNKSGIAKNYSMTVALDIYGQPKNFCSGFIIEAKNKTRIYYKVYAAYDITQNTITNFANINNTPPIITQTSVPADNSNIYDNGKLFNISIKDKEGDYFSFNFTIVQPESTLIYFKNGTFNTTFLYNFTSIELNKSNITKMNNLYAYWRFNNKDLLSGENRTKIRDYSKYARYNTTYGTYTVPIMLDKFGQGNINMTSTDYAGSPLIFGLKGMNASCTNGCTWNAWGTYNHVNVVRTLYSKYNSVYDPKMLQLGLDINNRLVLYFYLNSSYYCLLSSSSMPSDIGNWHMYSARFNKTNISIFIDGQLNKSTACKGSISSALWTQNRYFLIGSTDRLAYLSPDYWNGYLDEMSVWNTSLSNLEIQNLYSIKNRFNYSWKMTAYDSNRTILLSKKFHSCRCSNSICNVKCPMNCSFPNAITSMPAFAFSGTGKGNIFFLGNVNSLKNISAENSCLIGFLGSKTT